MKGYQKENRILVGNNQPMAPFLLFHKVRFFIFCLFLVSMNSLMAQVKVVEPEIIYEEFIGEEDEGVSYRGNRPLQPSISGRYWTHKHEKYFNSFEEIKADSTNVLRLYISSSDGGGIPAEIGRFVNLKGLEIYCNDPIKLPSEIWQLKLLDNLVIQCYDSGMVISDSIGDLTSLKRLEIRGPLKRLPVSIGKLTNLEELYAYSASFAFIPAEIGTLTNLRVLAISSIEVTELPASFGNLTNLKKLQIGAKLELLPSEIGKLVQLEELVLWGMNFETLPTEIGQLKQLRTLDLNSQLKTLPKEFGELTQLRRVSLDGNQLKTLPDEICQLTLLEELDLRSNQLVELPREIGKMISLKKLDLQENKLTTFPASIGDLSNIEELNALWNPLTSMPPEIMKLNPQASIDLERGGLVKIPDSVWRFINHNGCYISKVPATIAGNKLSYYLNQPSINKTAKLFVNGKQSLMYDRMSYDLLQMLDTIPDNNKAFYVFVINAILESKVVDRGTYDYYPYSEMQRICGSLLVERPCTFFKDIKHGAYKSSYGKWINAIGSLYNDYDYQETWPKIQSKLKTCGSVYLKEAEEIIEPLFYSEK
ncbi:MAG: hypothetical protein A3D31_04235 [Candidatus Fluviicola riflensis]|nr:MAG: hypothetical protein CHH17_10795 [Candidatus Fluviicola riflensis]OGS79184.1 MAG: hypothetical protein A3D31_04235 [Candidatus Fluviicola riflensis]OGS86616.1 MAG: hypothetical protein A2724_03695 [Fluviicola sp. RIFCSPHIGHO2_01_FULL_43_53]OGS88910.1 MAG: hypothetical protein A3E30_00965 [Fluviicola sp. RIFCSPHIGHO2_12_FULL_43_24]